ncbi:MAG: FUN14 domain-containing protein [bacterium]
MNTIPLFLLKTLGLGLLTGFLAGFLFKKISKLLVILIVIGVVAVFVLGHNEILNIDWLSVKETSNELYMKYLSQYEERLSIFFRNIPFVVGFILGAIFGIKKG